MMFKGDKPSVGFRLIGSRLIGFRLGCRLLAVLIFVMFGLMLALPSAALAGINEWTSINPVEADQGFLPAFSPSYVTDNTLFLFGYNSTNATINLYKSTNGGASWTQVSSGFTTGAYSLALSPSYSIDSTIFVGGWGSVYKSTNGGASWTQVSSGLPSSTSFDSLAISPNFATDSTIFAGSGANDGGVYKSTNGGITWTQVNSGLPSYVYVRSLAISPSYSTDSTLFAGVMDSVYKSTNGGTTWTQVSSGLPSTYFEAHSLAISPNYSTDGTIFAGIWDIVNGGVYKSTNGGATWTLVNSGLTSTNVISLAISPNYSTDGTIFAGTMGTDGIYKSTNGGTSWIRVGSDFPYADGTVNHLAVSPNFADDSTILSQVGGVVDAVFSYTFTTLPTTTLWTEPTSPNSNGWFTSPTTIHLDRSIAGSTYFKWNSEDTQTYSAPFSAREGTNVLHYWSVDTNGNTEEVKHQIFYVDTAAPAVFDLASPSSGSSTTNTSPTLAWNESFDSNSGLAKYQLYIDGSLSRDNISTLVTSATPGTALSTGSHTWYVKAIDNAGNIRQSSSTWTIVVNSASQSSCYMLVTPVCLPGWGGNNPDYLTPVLRFQFNDTGPLNQLSSIPPYPETSVNDPSYATFNSQGELFVANRHGNVGGGVGSIARFKFDANGNFIANGSITGNSLEAVTGLAFSPNGELFASNYVNGTISRFLFDAQGNAVQNGTIASGQHNQGLAFNSSGELFVAQDSSTIIRYLFDPNTGNAISNGSFVVSGASRLHGLAFSQTGELFMADAGTDRVHRYLFNGDGNPISNGTISVTGVPIGVAFSPAGELFVTSQNTVGISRFLFDGNGNAIPNGSTATDNLGGVAVAPLAVDIGDTTPPTTTLETTPTAANGTNGWFKTTPTITLTRNESGSTYYKWEYQSSFTTYLTPVQAPEGQHTLYYYSKDSANNAELVRSASFKVDPSAPSVPSNVKAMPMSSSRIDISWNASTDGISGVAGYKLYDADTGNPIYTGSATSCSHLGLNPLTTHSYYVKAFDNAGNESGQSATVSATTYREPVPTVPDIDGTCEVNLGNDITLNFDNVTNSGTTSVSVEYSAPSPPPGGFSFLDYYWDVSTTASFEDSITVTFPYDDSGLTSEQEAGLRLFHWEGGAWQDVTVLPVDTVNNKITGKVSSLSPFVVGSSSSGGGGGGSPSSSVGFGMNTNLLLILSGLLILAGKMALFKGRFNN